MKLFHASVFEQIGSDGVFVHLSTAEAVDVNGKLYAEVAGNLYAADSTPRWHETESAAREEAAVKVETFAATLAAQAVRIREGGR
jgi:hypothetical protein